MMKPKITVTFAIPWTIAHQAPQSMEFSRQEYWSGLPFPSPGDLPNPGIEPGSPALQADALPSEPPLNSTHYQSNGCNVVYGQIHPTVDVTVLSSSQQHSPRQTTFWAVTLLNDLERTEAIQCLL